MSDKISVGAISGAYGVRGELRIKSYCAVPEDIESYSPLSSEDGTRSFNLALVRPVKNGFVARITDVTSKEEADALRGTVLFAQRDQLPSRRAAQLFVFASWSAHVGFAHLSSAGGGTSTHPSSHSSLSLSLTSPSVWCSAAIGTTPASAFGGARQTIVSAVRLSGAVYGGSPKAQRLRLAASDASSASSA